MDVDAAGLATPGVHVFTEERAQAWTEKGLRCAERLLPLVGVAAVRHEAVTDPDAWPCGRFMVVWPDQYTQPRVLRHLPEVAFFMRLLVKAYRPLLDGHPRRRAALAGMSRLEMSLTSAALQLQLVTLESGYSMVRHHALMLFEATLWLDEPQRSVWLDLYNDMVALVDAGPGGRPDLDALAEIERGAFADFAELAPATVAARDAEVLLADSSGVLQRILDYQRCAAAAIGLLWRTYRALPGWQRTQWHRAELSTGYLRPGYLETEWMAVR